MIDDKPKSPASSPEATQQVCTCTGVIVDGGFAYAPEVPVTGKLEIQHCALHAGQTAPSESVGSGLRVDWEELYAHSMETLDAVLEREQETQSQLAETRGIAGELAEALRKALVIMDHLGDRLNAHDLAFDDEHLDTVSTDWEFVRTALERAKAAGISPEPKPARN